MAVNIVVGFPRSTTSLTMHICRTLGMQVAGIRWPGILRLDIDKLEEESLERIGAMNKFGSYEDPKVLSNICKVIPQEYDDRVVKIIINGLIKANTEKAINTIKNFNVIHLIRSPLEIFYSWDKVEKRRNKERIEKNEKILENKHPRSLYQLLSWANFLKWSIDNPWYFESTTFINSSDYYRDPIKNIDALISTFGLDVTDGQKERALDVVDVSCRTNVDNCWPEEQPAGNFCDLCFEAIYFEPSKREKVFSLVKKEIQKMLPEGRL